MSLQQLEVIIRDLQAVFSSWGEQVPLSQMRREWDDVFSKSPCDVGAKIEQIDAGGVPAMRVTAKNATTDRVILYYHGGGYVFGSPRSHKDLGEYLSQAAQAPVILLDYRLAPENPFPAYIEDARKAYAWLLKSFSPKQVAIAGDSAGGNLVFASLLSFRDHAMPMPACGIPLSPWTDMGCTGETFTTKADVDPMVHKEFTRKLADLVAPGADLKNPLLSPLYADLKGLPPLLIQVGERETLLDDSRRIAERAKKAGVDVTLEIEPGQVHVYQIFAARLDEGRAAITRIGAFVRKHTGG